MRLAERLRGSGVHRRADEGVGLRDRQRHRVGVIPADGAHDAHRGRRQLVRDDHHLARGDAGQQIQQDTRGRLCGRRAVAHTLSSDTELPTQRRAEPADGLCVHCERCASGMTGQQQTDLRTSRRHHVADAHRKAHRQRCRWLVRQGGGAEHADERIRPPYQRGARVGDEWAFRDAAMVGARPVDESAQHAGQRVHHAIHPGRVAGERVSAAHARALQRRHAVPHQIEQ